MQTAKLWAGRSITTLAVLFLVFDAAVKFTSIPEVMDSFTQLGYPMRLAASIGLIQLCCVMVYLIPRTAVVGAVLLTGYLGGAVATHVRVENPLFTHTLFPIYVAVLIWTGLYFRDERLRTFAKI